MPACQWIAVNGDFINENKSIQYKNNNFKIKQEIIIIVLTHKMNCEIIYHQFTKDDIF